MPKKSIRKKSVRKYRMKKSGTIHKKVTKYICKRKEKKSPSGSLLNKKRDVCCENKYDREKIADLIIASYKTIDPDEYLGDLHNDMAMFIDERWKTEIELEIESRLVKSKQQIPWTLSTEDEFKTLLTELPLYYLLSFLGDIYYRIMKQSDEKILSEIHKQASSIRKRVL
jgi:hypothetical protein